MENRISFSLTEAEQTQLNQHLNSIIAILQPKAIVLDAEAHTLSEPKNSWSEWMNQKYRHY